jgi:hypothetical protein
MYNNRQHNAPVALDSQQVARVCGGRYAPTALSAKLLELIKFGRSLIYKNYY